VACSDHAREKIDQHGGYCPEQTSKKTDRPCLETSEPLPDVEIAAVARALDVLAECHFLSVDTLSNRLLEVVDAFVDAYLETCKPAFLPVIRLWIAVHTAQLSTGPARR